MEHGLRVRVLPYAVADGAANMAADEMLLQAATAGTASLRFYGWAVPTVSLGYFQPARLRHEDPLLAPLPWVRRPSGGATLVHQHEVTYALGLPAVGSGPPATAWLQRLHALIAAALQGLGVPVTVHTPSGSEHVPDLLCFRQFSAGDLLLGSAKVVGSAQRRQRGALLQHGAILLARSPHTPELPGIKELRGQELSVTTVCHALLEALRRHTDWRLSEEDWTAAERDAIPRLATAKYASSAWNSKR